MQFGAFIFLNKYFESKINSDMSYTVLKRNNQTLSGGRAHYSKQFLYRKLRSQPVYSVKYTVSVCHFRCQFFTNSFNNNEYALMKFKSRWFFLV